MTDETERVFFRNDDLATYEWVSPSSDPLVSAVFEIVRRPTRKDQRLPCELAPDLFLSDARSLENSANITHVLNMAAGDTSRQLEGIVEKKIFADDKPCYDIMAHFDEALAFYNDARGGRLVVNCVAGINRSGAIATALFMWHTRTPLLPAVRHVYNRRGSYLWNSSFRSALVAWARSHDLCGDDGRDDDEVNLR